MSPIFLLPKFEDCFRMILNQKKLNEDMLYIHFKMETIKPILTLVTPNCYNGKGRHRRCILFCSHPTRTSEVSKILI